MKKILLILVLIGVLFLASCNAPTIHLEDEEGWEIFQVGWSLTENQFLVQH